METPNPHNPPNPPTPPNPELGADPLITRILDAWCAMASKTECACRPYRGGTTHNLHLPFCGWNGRLDGFLYLAEAFGVFLRDLPVLNLPDAPVCSSQPGQAESSQEELTRESV